MIGFEFETSVQMRWSDGTVIGDKEVALCSLRPGARWNFAWKAVSDTGNLEVVTEPFNDEAADRGAEVERILDVFDDIGSFVGLLLRRPEKDKGGPAPDVTLVPDSLADIARLGDANKEGVTFTSPTLNSLTASPQATAGFTLDRVWLAAMRIVGTKLPIFEDAEASVRQEGNPAGTSLSGMNPIQGTYLVEAAVRARMEAETLQHQDSDLSTGALAAYEGFLTIVISYLLMGSRQVNEWQYLKLIAPLMSRVSLHIMYQDPDVKPYADRFFTPERVLNAAGLDNNPRAQLYRKPVGSKNLNRVDWINSIRDGNDKLALLDKTETGSMSALDNEKDFSPTSLKRIYPLELRRLPQVIPPPSWHDLAISLYDISRLWRRIT
jgi:hypothetical protein